MTIKFTDGSQLRVGNVVAVVYGQPNIGKTTLALTASRPVLLDFDGGGYRAGNKVGKRVAQVRAWADVAGLDAADLADADTVVVDTIGTCLDIMAADIIRRDPKCGQAGGLSLPGYGRLKSMFKNWLAALRLMGKDVVLVAHMAEEQRGNDVTVDRIIAAGASKQEVYQQADIMGSLKPDATGRRILSFDLTESSFGKNVGLPKYVVPPPQENSDLMANVLAAAKEALNASAAQAAEETARVQKLRVRLLELPDTPEAFNEQLATMQAAEATPVDRRLLVEVGTTKGLVFDPASKQFARQPAVASVPVDVPVPAAVDGVGAPAPAQA